MNAPSILPIQMQNRPEPKGDVASVSISEVFERLVGLVRRHLPMFLVIIACSMVLGLVYFWTTPPIYTAYSKLLIDSDKMKILQQQQTTAGGETPVDTWQIDSQVELLKSDSIGLSVVKRLRLFEDPEFTERPGLFAKMRALFSTPKPKSETELAQTALDVFLANRFISRLGRTYVLELDYTSLSPTRAAEIANAIADAYIDDLMASKYQATRRGSSWLQDRIAELRTQATDADRAVLEYKERYKLVDVVGSSGISSVRLLGEQQLSDLNAQLGAARAAAAEAQAKLERVDDVIKHDVADATVTDSLKNDVIKTLRSQYFELSSREAIWAARYGPAHLAVVTLRTQMDSIRTAIKDELSRIAGSYKSEYEIASGRVEKLEKDLAASVSESQSTNRDRLGLRELESTAKAYHSIHDNFLERNMEVIQQQSFPITETRAITVAVPPSHKSGPSGFRVLGIAGCLGLMLSFGLTFVREAFDGVFRTTKQVETSLKTDCLAVVPKLNSTSTSSNEGFAKRLMQAGISNVTAKTAAAPTPVRASLEKILDIVADSRLLRNGSATDLGLRTKTSGAETTKNFERQVVEQPLSAFAEAFRSIKVAADIRGSNQANRVIAVTSALPQEGKSTVSSNFAQSVAYAGKNVILIDGDLRNPTLTRSLAPTAKTGLIEVLAGDVELRDAICIDGVTKLAFLPAVLKTRFAHTNEILASAVFKQLIDDLRKRYDYVIIDLPPIAPVVDVRAAAHVVDSFIFVIEWGRTKVSFIQRQLDSVPEMHDRMLGVVLNKTNMKMFEKYEGNFGKYRYHNYYAAAATDSAEKKA
jgi:polysaccharide biosynthesis transport protein